MARVAGRVLARNEADERGELSRVVTSREVAQLRGDGHGRVALHAAHRLERLDDRPKPPRRCDLDEFILKTTDALSLLAHGAQRFLLRARALTVNSTGGSGPRKATPRIPRRSASLFARCGSHTV